MHATGSVAPCGHADPAGHAAQSACPTCAWNLPAAQRVHAALPSSAALPASHAVGTTLPVAHAYPARQSAQSNADVRLVALPYVPLSHSSAADAPSAQCDPSSHDRQPVALADG